jgi:flagellar protein FlgJ
MLDTFDLPLRSPPVLAPAANADPRKMRAAAVEFEGSFLGQMLAPMFTGTTAEVPFGGGQAEESWRSLEIDEIGKTIARAGGIGLADYVYREMLALQEKQKR